MTYLQKPNALFDVTRMTQMEKCLNHPYPQMKIKLSPQSQIPKWGIALTSCALTFFR